VVSDQPLASVEWVDPATLRANDYNPNHVAPVEMRLLRISLLEDGWTQPIVARPDGEIVDGFHRWTLAQTHQDVRALADGLVPVVRLRHAETDPAGQRMATIRHNRARGAHGVVKMAEIVEALVNEHGLSREDVAGRLQMDREEVDRLLDHGSMVKRGGGHGFSRAWVPSYTPVSE
jgi:ParB-like chromosome segregation protein Spo0J